VVADVKLPVVLLHGALRSSWGLLPTAVLLRRRGLAVRGFDYPTRKGTLAEHAVRLQAFVRAWQPTPPPVLGFVTHSMGALVVRAYLAAHADPATRHRVVMLSPPNRGSQLALRNADGVLFRWVYGDAARELVPARAQALPAAPDNADVLVLAGGRRDPRGYNPLLEGDDDGVVAVAEMGMPGVEPVVVGGVHATMQWRPAVLTRAADFILAGR
jgi:pimeloyl-ACP methyl ester carboxylesterase